MNDILQHIITFLSYDDSRPLIFTEGSFWIFFALLLLGYSVIFKTRYLRTFYLLAFSVFFYYKSSGYFFVLLIFSTICDYVLGLLISQTTTQWKRKFYVGISVLVNLSLLSFFKYSYFFADTVNTLFGSNYQVFNFLAHWANVFVGSDFDVSSIVLPVGISFFTFQTISYTVDVYRRKVAPVTNIVDFGFYVSFFPQLVAGPIVRAAEFIPQLYRKYSLTNRELGYAMFLIINGMVKKVVISDYISLNFVDRVFANPLTYSGFENLLATYGYSIQIYCDFSGYTDMATGLALLLGFRLPINFNSPYKALNITDFWHRWHISLSSWLRDYLYIPLGGNRRGTIMTYVNLLVTMLLGGLWHGANVRFVIWGGIHGVSLALHKLWMWIFPSKGYRSSGWKRFITAFFTFHLICLSWIFFRGESLDLAWGMLRQIAMSFGWQSVVDVVISYLPVLSLMLFAYAVHWLPVSWKEYYRGKFINTHLAIKILLALVVAVIIFQVKSADIQPFIYFRF